MSDTQDIPRGHILNSQGHPVLKKMVSPLDLERDKVVRELVSDAKKHQLALTAYKKSSMDAVQSFVDFSAEQYGAKLGGKKGNVTLLSYDGNLKVIRSYAESLVFDERLQVAKSLIDECIKGWIKNSRSEIKVLIDNAFQTDKAGKINTASVLSLKKLDINDEKWQKAMQAINDSLQVSGSKSYIRLYERDEAGEFKPISLDLAAV